MLTFDNVIHAPLGKLKAAVDHWSAMKARLDQLAEDARTTMAAKAKDDYWRGVNAEVTKPFVDKTAKEFTDAAKAAAGLHKILQDGYEAFKKAQDDLKKITDTEAQAQGLRVTPAGVVEAREPVAQMNNAELRRDPDYLDLIRRENEAIGAMQQRIDAIIETCDDADVACSNALKANITGDKHNFSAPKYSSLDAEEAQRALDLARRGRNLSHEELERLNELLEDNSSSKEFARTFYDGLGPKGALEFFGQLSTDTHRYGKLDEERLADVQELQKNLGLNLAQATQGNDKWAENWSTELRKLGTERVPLAKNDYNAPFGYQLLGGIMRHGDYNAKFLNPIAEHVAQLHAKDPRMFEAAKGFGGVRTNPFNPSGVNGAGYDPMVAMLEALGHSPAAAKEFFSADPTAYKEDGTPGGEVKLGSNEDGSAIDNYLDFFAQEKYAFFPDVNGHHPDEVKNASNFLPDALGHALEAATLGHAWDDPAPKLVRDGDTAGIMRDVVTIYGDAEFLKKHHSALADSLGAMGAGYIDDLNWSLAEGVGRDVYGPKSTEMDVRSAHADFGQHEATKFLTALGQHPDAYATVSAAERVYVTSMLEAELEKDGQISEGRGKATVYTGAMLQGLLDQARGDQIEAEGLKVQEDYEKAEEARGAWIEFGTTAAIAAGVAFLPATVVAAGAAAVVVPLAVETGSGAMETLAGQVIGDWSDKSVEDHKGSVEDRIRDDQTSHYTEGKTSADAPLKRFLMYHGSLVNDDLEQTLTESRNSGYVYGSTFGRQRGNSPQPDEPGDE
ncbi:hypothetical protein ACFV9D_37725 [Streptomyces sp. NPDC059875]|uniref:hypothetical protein n=1 Tax=unclassified Streptomyces TaxID=2593676 RepID=UPI0036618615